jgi:hypothetical protein
MQSGDIFSVDNDAILDMENEEFSVVWKDKQKNEHRLQPGTKFRINKAGLVGLPIEVRASKIDPITGKCGRGRPRRFPAAVVYRLLGEVAPDPSVVLAQPVLNTSDVVDGQTTTDVQATDELDGEILVNIVEQDEPSEDEIAAQKARVASLLGLLGDDSSDNDW